jgi:hypothetical protein
VLQPFSKHFLKSLTEIHVTIFFTDDFISSVSEKHFPSSTLFEFWKQPKASWSYVRRVQQMMKGARN